MKRLILALAALTFVVPFAGCGQSGPLYISDNPSKIQQPPPKAESTADEEQNDNGDADRE